MRALLTVTAGLVLLTSCKRPEAPAGRDTTASETAGVDLKAEEQRIRASEQRWRQALAAKDTAAVMAFYAESGH